MKNLLFLIYLAMFIFMSPVSGQAFWIWTPESNKWVNPKHSMKETPDEQLTLAVSFFESEQYKKAEREFKKLLKHYPKSRQAPDAQFYLAKLFEAQGKYFQAFEACQKVVYLYPFSDRFSDVVKKQYDIGLKLLDGWDEKREWLQTLSGADYNIVEVFRTVIKNAPYGELAAPAQYKIGLYFLENRLYQEARDELEKVLNDYPDSDWVQAAKYQIAVADAERSTAAQYDQKVTKAAVEGFKDFVEIYPDAELSSKAQEEVSRLRNKEAESEFVVAQFYEKSKNYKAAKIYYQIVADEYMETPWGRKALEKIGALGVKE